MSGITKEEKRALYWQSFAAIVTRLEQAGKRVIVLGPVPELGAALPRYIARTGHAVANLDVDTRRFYDARQASVLDFLAASGWEVIYPADTLCNADTCTGVREGRLLYYDTDHLSPAGARIVVAPLLDSLGRP